MLLQLPPMLTLQLLLPLHLLTLLLPLPMHLLLRLLLPPILTLLLLLHAHLLLLLLLLQVAELKASLAAAQLQAVDEQRELEAERQVQRLEGLVVEVKELKGDNKRLAATVKELKGDNKLLAETVDRLEVGARVVTTHNSRSSCLSSVLSVSAPCPFTTPDAATNRSHPDQALSPTSPGLLLPAAAPLAVTLTLLPPHSLPPCTLTFDS